MTRFGLALAVLFAAFTAQAQTTPPAGAVERKNSTREEQRQKVRAARQKAVEICQSAQADKHRDCMRHELCAHAKSPVQCEARAKQRAERRKAPKPSS
jgi:hypothetical protein